MIISRVVAFIIYSGLAFLSLWSWAIAVRKWQEYAALRRETFRFRDMIKKANGELIQLSSGPVSLPPIPMVCVYEAARREMDYFLGQSKGALSKVALEHIHSAIYRAITEELEKLNKSMPVLATAISCGPFLGLLGTVSGILLVFRRLGTLGNASISVVAPGVYQALLTTMVGLLVAIPAVLFYNYFVAKHKRVASETENFAMELMSAIEKRYC
ncbi:MAG: MotA/TolQ/ExbB proton channel family protein [Candidatus Aureabacteria bacterium]|nr:MotA/TolQ/ExbB proton channel family protein [Candidatus Auribacterota bacterium]